MAGKRQDQGQSKFSTGFMEPIAEIDQQNCRRPGPEPRAFGGLVRPRSPVRPLAKPDRHKRLASPPARCMSVPRSPAESISSRTSSAKLDVSGGRLAAHDHAKFSPAHIWEGSRTPRICPRTIPAPRAFGFYPLPAGTSAKSHQQKFKSSAASLYRTAGKTFTVSIQRSGMGVDPFHQSGELTLRPQTK
jgi:hypothetical protein